MKLQIGTEEMLSLIEGLGLTEGIKESLSGALVALLDAESMNKVIGTAVESKMRDAIDDKLHGRHWRYGYKGEIGKEIEEILRNAVKSHFASNDNLTTVIKDIVKEALNGSIKQAVSEVVEQELQAEWEAHISKRLEKTDVEGILKAEAKKMLTKAMEKFGD